MAKKKVKKKVSATDLGARTSPARRPGVGKAIRRPPPKPTPRPAVTTAAPKPAAFNPVAAMTPQQIDERARQIAQSQVQPELDLIGQETKRTDSAHENRNAQLQGWYGAQQGQLNQAFSDTQRALDKMLSLSSTTGQQGSDALAAALRAAGAGSSDLARMTGTQAPPGEEAALLASHAAGVAPQREALAQAAMARLGAQGERRSLASIGGIESIDQERRRYGAEARELGGRRQAAAGRLGGLINEARTGLESRELDKYKTREDLNLAKKKFGEDRANRLFQQWLATKELGLKEKDLNFDQWLSRQNLSLEGAKFAHQQNIDVQELGLRSREIDATIAHLNADAKKEKDANKRKQKEDRAKAWANGRALLEEYLAPRKGEADVSMRPEEGYEGPEGYLTDPADEDKRLKVYKRDYNTAYKRLTSIGLSRSDALRIMMRSGNPQWEDLARRYYNRLKRRSGGAEGYSKSHQNTRAD